MAERARRRRSSARREKAAGEGADARLLDRQPPFRKIRNPFPPLNPLSEEQMAKVHDMAMRIDTHIMILTTVDKIRDPGQVIRLDKLIIENGRVPFGVTSQEHMGK